MATKNSKQNKQTISTKILLITTTFMILIGSIVMAYLYFNSDIHYKEYYELQEENSLYLLENQEEIMQVIQQAELNPHEVGHVFIPQYPAQYVDIQHINQHNVPYMNQNDPSWRDKPYGTDGSQSMWENGCAIVVLAMVDSYFQDTFTRPESIAKWADDRYYMDQQGTSWSIYAAFGEAFDYQVEDLENDFYLAMDYLQGDHLIVVSVGPGIFTDGGHVMLIRGFQDGLVYLNDPNDTPSKFFSIQGIPAQQIIDSALNYWAISPS